MKSHAPLVASLLVALLAVPLHAAKYKIHWLLGHQNLDYFEEAAASFKTAVEKGSHGDIEIDIVTATSDAPVPAPGGTSHEIAVAVAKGEAEMGHSFTDVIGALDPRMHIFEAPYLFRDYRHMEGVIEGPLGAELLEGLRAHQMVGLSFTYSGGASALATSDREIRRPEDLKGLKVGVYGDAVNQAWLKSLNATPVAIEHRLPSIQSLARGGSLDAVVITWRNLEREALNRNFKYVNLMESTYLVSVTYINEKFFASLPESYRKLIMEESRKAGRIERASTIELNERSKRTMLAKGVRPVYLTEQNRRKFLEALQPAYKNSIEGLLGKELIEKVKRTGDGVDHPSIPDHFATR